MSDPGCPCPQCGLKRAAVIAQRETREYHAVLRYICLECGCVFWVAYTAEADGNTRAILLEGGDEE